MSFTILLVIKQNTHDNVDNFERFVQIGMPTYEAFLDLNSVKEFMIVAPNDEIKKLMYTLQTRWPKWPWKFVPEDKIIDKSLSQGWARQQTAKLAVAMLITTDHYLIIDDDTYLTRPFSYKDMFDVENKVILTRTDIDFPFFFLWSNQVVEFDMEVVQKEPFHMAITPEIFITSEVRSLVKWLVSKYGDNKQWQKYLANHKFTEYCLYWIWLIKNNINKRMYSTSTDAPRIYDYATTSEDHDLTTMVRSSFDKSKKHYFSFVQSSLRHPLDIIKKEIKQCM
jgi:hypothetical protein